jgi:hypothetical protein
MLPPWLSELKQLPSATFAIVSTLLSLPRRLSVMQVVVWHAAAIAV